MPERIGSRVTYDTPLFALRVEAQLARNKLVRLSFPEQPYKSLIEMRIGEVEMGKRQVRAGELQTLSTALGEVVHKTPEEIFQVLSPHLSEDAESLLGRKHRPHFNFSRYDFGRST